MKEIPITPADLKEAREGGGIERPVLAAVLGVHDTTLWRWEEGKGKDGKPPKKHTMKAWHAALKALLVDKLANEGRIYAEVSEKLAAARGAAQPPAGRLEAETSSQEEVPASEGCQTNDRDPEPAAGSPPHRTCADWRCQICNPPEFNPKGD